ncbi:hypothetical protein SELMODRAFT_270619 [Selaginella moellendorffii]|uniref:Uncharacterized protein n=1 Tax=Selaginella moellendorffii TaxID=88036 RepID=D8R7T6_SELML|nr:uncharacterized protein LOC9631865 [Selaginella moellendorffii]XP_024531248.1 uncharacterized protein LOC9632023 [Selaginella moellendorffii]XP_024531252.1 uncharacterized protein LOC9632023 [Selaginella moellendorffii]XP_024531258.1 uncharacterized protein LOC9632023 [Selaginella moellendorffii]EFJ31589.1 hypothetical protein SELMODRAFT_270619 [Selaginella moellendorffii]|eukprot:XP_024527957.1 uncharacterized protein LOC9631865 [Selaginella moellendorffii]
MLVLQSFVARQWTPLRYGNGLRVGAHEFQARRGRNSRIGSTARVVWDPENLFGAPQTGHITRRMIQKKLSSDAEQDEIARQETQRQLDRQRAAREARVVPESDAGLIEFFLETQAQEIEFEIARCRLRLTDSFLSFLNTEIASLKFKINRTQDIEDRLVELEALQKVLTEGIEAYDRLATDLVQAKERVARIFASKDKKATLLEMVASNELDRSLLVLLDQNIVTARSAGQKEAADFMTKIRGAVLKYITL